MDSVLCNLNISLVVKSKLSSARMLCVRLVPLFVARGAMVSLHGFAICISH